MKSKYLLLGIFLMQATTGWAMYDSDDEVKFKSVGGRAISFPPIKEPGLPTFLDLTSYKKVATFNKLSHLTYDLSSDIQNKPQQALMALFGNSTGEINSLWKTDPLAWGAHEERPYNLGALYNRLERYTEPHKKYAIFRAHIDLVKSIAENLFLYKKQHIVTETTNKEIKENIGLFGNHMKVLSKIVCPSNMRYWALQDDLKDYRQWLGDIKTNTSKADLLLEAYSGLYDWEFVQSSGPLEIGSVAKVKTPSQILAATSDHKDATNFYQTKKDKYDQGRLTRHMDLVETEKENSALSFYHKIEVCRILDVDEQEDRYVAQSIEKALNQDKIRKYVPSLIQGF